MMTRRTWVVLAGMMAVAGIPRMVAAGPAGLDCSCLMRLAGEVCQHAKELECRIRDDYRHNPHVRHLLTLTREVAVLAEQLHCSAKRGDWRAVRCDLDQVTLAVRQLGRAVRDADAHCGAGYPGKGWKYGNVPTRSEATRRLLECLDRTLCQLRDELVRLTAHVPEHGQAHRHGSHGHPSSAPAHRNRGGTSFSVSNGRFTISFGR